MSLLLWIEYMSKERDKALVFRFENLWEEFSSPLNRYIKRYVNNTSDAEDILQMVFLKTYNNLGSLNEADKIHAWIYTVTKNAINDYYRTKKQEANIIFITEDILCKMQEEETENYEIAQCLKEMIKYLPEKYKQAIILTEFQNHTQKELALKLGLSVSGVKSRVQRARVMLKEMLLNCCDLKFDCKGNIIDYQHKNKDCKFC